jgi:hypothetical protein
MNSAVPGFEAVPFNALLTKLHIPNLAGAFYKCPTDAPKLTGYSDIPCRQIQLGIWGVYPTASIDGGRLQLPLAKLSCFRKPSGML